LRPFISNGETMGNLTGHLIHRAASERGKLGRALPVAAHHKVNRDDLDPVSHGQPADRAFFDRIAAKLVREFGLSLATAHKRVMALAISAQPRPASNGTGRGAAWS
jgi:hypothetical protein